MVVAFFWTERWREFKTESADLVILCSHLDSSRRVQLRRDNNGLPKDASCWRLVPNCTFSQSIRKQLPRGKGGNLDQRGQSDDAQNDLPQRRRIWSCFGYRRHFGRT